MDRPDSTITAGYRDRYRDHGRDRDRGVVDMEAMTDLGFVMLIAGIVGILLCLEI
jgi:hypothetical protein